LICRLKAKTNGGRRYKQAYIKKVLSKKNCKDRLIYTGEYKNKTIEDFWQWIIFTDEFHVDPAFTGASYILREQRAEKRTAIKNIQERPQKEGNKLYIAGWVTYYEKCKKLIFYHDEEENKEQPDYPPKPR
jgi:hypothetical protein